MKDTPKKSKMPLVIGLIALFVISGTAALISFFWIKRPNTDNDTVAKEATSEKETSLPPAVKETEEPKVQQTSAPTPEVTTEPVDLYQAYYDKMDAGFRNYIISTAEAAEIDTYSNMLKDALMQKDAAMCRTLKNNLDKLEKQLKKNSEEKIESIKKKAASWEKKSSSAQVKKSKSYKTLKEQAEKLLEAGNYAGAKRNYEDCIDLLKNAGKNVEKKQTEKSTDYYKPVRTDDDTYYLLSNYNLSKNDVQALSAEEVRYYVNTIFAVAGYRFTNQDIQKYFEHQSWYGGGITNNQQDILDLLNDPDHYKGTPLAHNFNLLRKG